MYPQYVKRARCFQGSPAILTFQCVRVRSGLMLFYPGKAPDTCQVFYVVRELVALGQRQGSVAAAVDEDGCRRSGSGLGFSILQF